MPRICIVTPSYLVSSPRVVKEAEALSEAGHEVTVLHTHGPLRQIAQWDEELYSHRPWKRVAVRWDGRGLAATARFWVGTATEKLSRTLAPDGGWGPSWAAWAEFRAAPFLAALAQRHRADLYIGHYPAGLHAAGLAAQRHGAKLAFDAEDLHIGEFGPEQSAEAALRHPRARRIHRIESWWLPRCAYVTASSEGIATALIETYGIAIPSVILNCFHPIETLPQHTGDPIRLAWFSQTIGLDRGLEELFEALSDITIPLKVSLRGWHNNESQRIFSNAMKKLPANVAVEFLDLLPPDKLTHWLAEHDIGIASEVPRVWNRDICLTNKIFNYMSAGCAVIASDTSAQKNLFAQAGDIGCCVKWSRVPIAQAVTRLSADRDYLMRCRRTALLSAQTIFSRERQQQKLQLAVAEAFAK